MASPGISIVIPAYNEEKFLPATLGAVNEARRVFEAAGLRSETIVVNNLSTDRTEAVAVSLGAKVVPYGIRNISGVRNAGIRAAAFDVVITIDADSSLPPSALVQVWDFMKDETQIGAALGVKLISDKLLNRLAAAVIQALVFRASGIVGAMFCFRKDAALAIGGFPEDRLIAEDSAFAIALRNFGKAQGKTFGYLKAVQVGTLDRKDVNITALPALIVQVLRAFFGKKQTVKDLSYWYEPDRLGSRAK